MRTIAPLEPRTVMVCCILGTGASQLGNSSARSNCQSCLTSGFARMWPARHRLISRLRCHHFRPNNTRTYSVIWLINKTVFISVKCMDNIILETISPKNSHLTLARCLLCVVSWFLGNVHFFHSPQQNILYCVDMLRLFLPSHPNLKWGCVQAVAIYRTKFNK